MIESGRKIREMRHSSEPRLTVSGTVRRSVTNALRRRPVNSSTEIRLTRLCTQRCRQCRIYDRRTEPHSLTPSSFSILARRLREYGASIAFLGGGEPTMVEGIEAILEEAKRTFPVAVTLVTNLYNRPETVRHAARIALSLDINIQTSLDGLGETGDVLRGATGVSETVLGNMERIAALKATSGSRSILYANTVMNRINLKQIPTIIEAVRERGWRSTTGIYHSLTSTTQFDSELLLNGEPGLRDTVDFLARHPNVYTLGSFLKGIPDFLAGKTPKRCLYLDQPLLGSRLCIMEDGNVYLCKGDPIGNLLRQPMVEILDGRLYRERLDEYRACPGCWTACYTQRSLLLRPRSLREVRDIVVKGLRVGKDRGKFRGQRNDGADSTDPGNDTW